MVAGVSVLGGAESKGCPVEEQVLARRRIMLCLFFVQLSVARAKGPGWQLVYNLAVVGSRSSLWAGA
jgi:hypothetical protein